MIRLAKLFSLIAYKFYCKIGQVRANYYKLILGGVGEGFIINGRPLIFQPEKIFIGDHVTINNGVTIAPRGKVTISDYVVMSRGSQITAGELDTSHWADDGFKQAEHIEKPVFLGEGTWLCVNSIVLPGVSISGKGVIVAAGAVVTHDVTEDYVIVAGVPAKIVKKLK